ncbi:MAG: N-acetylgalactosamine 6-sulfate sulfatase, partial [Leptolyngbya sp. SIO4C5]|nr:N-acetylgalactosamine 6-sulfate sulfatase [Leptolyngbya sp. SIO4C5]
LLEAAGVEVRHRIEGMSVLPALRGEDQPLPERDLYFERREGNLRFNGLTIHALRRGDWKLVKNSPYTPMELYNLATDPAEERNVIAQHPDVYRELAESLREHIRLGGAVPWTDPEAVR